MPIKLIFVGRSAATLAVIFCATCSQAGPVPRDGILRINGILTDEGVECPALRGDDGQLYTLTGDLSAAAIGDEVCVDGQLVEISICQQGTTLHVEELSLAPCEG